MQHLFDALAVGELIWDEYLGAPVRLALDGVAGGRGRELFAFLCGIHDIGKATPKFQSKNSELATRVNSAGLSWGRLSTDRRAWHHTRAGGRIVRDECAAAGWNEGAIDWVWPMVGGHHGVVPARGKLRPSPLFDDHGRDEHWAAVRRWIIESMLAAAGFVSLRDAEPSGAPPVGDQLAVSGSIIMADWLASNCAAFPPIDDAAAVSVTAARTRARVAWSALDLRAGIGAHRLPEDLMAARFGRSSRPLQRAAERVARDMPAPGLVIIEAPMGEGKTEAALIAAEVLAERFGLRGVFVGLPTQATSDAMFDRVHDWAASVAPRAPIMLLHGKRMFNAAFVQLRTSQRYGEIYEDVEAFGYTGDPFGLSGREAGSAAVADWFMGRKRGLLAPIGIGTIDNLLHAGTRTPHVMLRHTGLAQKVVILDEVHAASVYMAQFLQESLRWLGSARTPVVLLTATLPPRMRTDLVHAYLDGAGGCPADLPDVTYPAVSAVGVADGGAFTRVEHAEPWRSPQEVRVDLLADTDDEDGAVVADRLAALLADGGTALVIRNTVERAQRTFHTLVERFGGDVELLHARLTVAERARRTEAEMRRLGPGGAGARPRHILVATQVAEQSFDVDADLLVTDLAPIDLLVQRAGRIHRHERGRRPAAVSTPTVLVTGVTVGGPTPTFPDGSRYIYGEFSLLRTLALVQESITGGGWTFPADIPRLVGLGYGPGNTAAERAWPDLVECARQQDLDKRDDLRRAAGPYLLVQPGAPLPADLSGLHEGLVNAASDERVGAVVRDGDPAAEVVLIRRGADGSECTLSGRTLSTGGVLVGDDAVIEEALGSIVRLAGGRVRGYANLAEAAAALKIPDAWQSNDFLRYMRPLVLDDDMVGVVADRRFRYDDRLGLVDLRRFPPTPAGAGPNQPTKRNHG